MSEQLPEAHWTRYVPVKCGWEPLRVNLTTLSPEKKRPVWERIKANSPATADLLSSAEFQQAKGLVEEFFGPVEIVVDLAVLGGGTDGNS